MTPPLGRTRSLNCRKVAKVLQTVLDGEAAPRTSERVRAHLEDCRRCGLEAEAYRAIRASLARHAPVVDPLTRERLLSFTDALLEGEAAESRDGFPSR